MECCVKMATISCLKLGSDNKFDYTTHRDEFLGWLVHAERKIFPHHEALDFDTELKKRNTMLIIIVKEPLHSGSTALVAYSMVSRHKAVAFLHKICVLESYRRRGIASRILQMHRNQLEKQQCDKLLLWVDEERTPARSLYSSFGFSEANRVENYYAPGRTGIQMFLYLLRE